MEHVFHVVALLLLIHFPYKNHLQRSTSRILPFHLNRFVILVFKYFFKSCYYHFSWSYNPNITIYFFSALEKYHWFGIWSTIIPKNVGNCTSDSIQSFGIFIFACDPRCARLQTISVPLRVQSASHFQELPNKQRHCHATINKEHQVWTP